MQKDVTIGHHSCSTISFESSDVISEALRKMSTKYETWGTKHPQVQTHFQLTQFAQAVMTEITTLTHVCKTNVARTRPEKERNESKPRPLLPTCENNSLASA